MHVNFFNTKKRNAEGSMAADGKLISGRNEQCLQSPKSLHGSSVITCKAQV